MGRWIYLRSAKYVITVKPFVNVVFGMYYGMTEIKFNEKKKLTKQRGLRIKLVIKK